MKRSLLVWIATLALAVEGTLAQTHVLKPGFDRQEYTELMRMYVKHYEGVTTQIPDPTSFQTVYRSPVVGLDNRWDLWKSTKVPLAVVNVRGTTINSVSWLENFYAAMIPAQGELKLTNRYTFKYQLAKNPKAAVHIGWTVGMAFLAQDILPKIDSCYRAGIKDFLLMGHSQGGALTFLLTSHLYSLQEQGTLPQDIRFKTYCSAGPKPGNLYYAHEFEYTTRGDWAFNVVNSADWVPETPFSVQTISDFNKTNPFTNADQIIRKQKFPARLVMKRAYKQLRKPSERAQRNYEKYLGRMASQFIKKSLPEFEVPAYAKTSDYVRTGTSITLLADDAYYQLFPDSEENVFVHHLIEPYLYLLEKW
ncbi:hypothetical protein GCM10027275_20390 [Rhabdobacter roseus]|uniref:Pimeloyl-ACP methyl ester carboxylesterase n=1 Tax=Rhabdobacter roseus TaxID=1655419 RepID=A0A840TVJ3_9BACT|nr:lipase family protein [Rhabdobacter roseus]MBB5283970.1 pimeloyl-ACP methyl ester carboxylesterase [Rhabdobacter roseus]